MDNRTTNAQVLTAHRARIPQDSATTAVPEPARSTTGLGLELTPTWLSPFCYADVMGLLTYVTVVAGPSSWFELPVPQGDPATPRHGDPPPPRSTEEHGSRSVVASGTRGPRRVRAGRQRASRRSLSAVHPAHPL
jgi:hypothetical protein